MKVIVLFFAVLWAVVQSAPTILSPLNDLPRIKKIGGYHIGGHTVSLVGRPLENVTLQAGQPPRPYDPNGDFTSGQMYVHYTLLAEPSSSYPILFIHGGFMTGVCWEDTPDGRPGWQTYFLRAGFNVYVADAVERGRSGWSKFPDIFPSAPIYASKQYSWTNFRIGVPNTYTDTNRVPYENSQFDVNSFDQFHKLAVPRWTVTDDLITAAYIELVDKICTPKCILIGHSQGGTFSYNITIQRPDKIAAVITVEPGSAPPLDRFDPTVVKGVKHMTIWGDNVLASTPQWQSNWNICVNYVNTLRSAGVSFDFIQLVPEYGIVGNTHFLMTDKNSDQVAGIVYTWLVNNSYVSVRASEENGANAAFINVVLAALALFALLL